jgi:putative inorganic carbon (HCO3(-)) transporter
MRDIALALLLAGVIPASFMRPWFGALAWVWISIMNPHKLAYGFMWSAPLAQLIALAMIAGLFFRRDHRGFPMAAPMVWMILFTLWMCITFPFSLVDTSANWEQLNKILKIMLMNAVVLIPLHTRRHVDLLIGAMALSIAFYGAKGGLFAIATGANYHVVGPESTFIGPNNEIGLAIVMTIPLLYYLSLRAEKWWVRWAVWIGIFLSSIGAVATQSRGALLAIAAMAGVLFLRSQQRWRLILPILLTSAFILAFMPDKWFARMETIQDHKSDASAMGRIYAWILAWNVARNHFFGGGFTLETEDLFERYSPSYEFVAVAHSLYFQVLGHHGFVGLFLYLGMGWSTLRTCWWIHANSSAPEDKQLARLAEVSFVGFGVGGAFLSLAYFDGPYYLMVALVVLRYKVLGNAKVTLPSKNVVLG